MSLFGINLVSVLTALVGVGLIVGSCGGDAFQLAAHGSGGSGNGNGQGGQASGGTAGHPGTAGAATGGATAGASGTTSDGGSSASGSGGDFPAGAAGSAGASGGSAGASGSGGGGFSGAPWTGICRVSADCKLSDDCCACRSVGINEPVPSCNQLCIQSSCSAQNIGESDVRCVSGRCVLNRSCNRTNVSCPIPAPACATGSLQVVNGSCYSGQCMPAGECADVTSCDDCALAGLTCVIVMQATTQTRVYHCVDTPAQCQQSPTCSCMGVCTATGIQCTNPNSTVLTCN